jgi:hypothetical protein
MKKALFGLAMILGGLVGFFIGGVPAVRALGLGLAATGVVVLIVASMEHQ